jgi:hypothetical protein
MGVAKATNRGIFLNRLNQRSEVGHRLSTRIGWRVWFEFWWVCVFDGTDDKTSAVCALADVLTLDVNSITSLVVKLNQLNTNIIA